MAKIKIIVRKRFLDKYDHSTHYEVGGVHEFDDERAKDLIERGLVDTVSEPEIETRETVEETDIVTEGKKAEYPEQVTQTKPKRKGK